MVIIPYTRISPIENLVTTAVITQEMVARGPSNIFEMFIEHYAKEHIQHIKSRAFFEPRIHELNFERWDDPLRNQTKVAFRWLLKNAVGDRVVLVGGPGDGQDIAAPYNTKEIKVDSIPREFPWKPELEEEITSIKPKHHFYEYAGYAVNERARAFTYRGLR